MEDIIKILQEEFNRIAELAFKNNINLHQVSVEEMWKRAWENAFINYIEIKDDILQEIEEEKVETHNCRWPESSKTAIEYKDNMEYLLNSFDPYDLELPKTKKEICKVCQIKLCNLGDYKNWLKKYHNDFYYKFIIDFPEFGSRND